MPATLTVTLRSGDGTQLSDPMKRLIDLPVTTEEWPRIAGLIRDDRRFQATYDGAESAEIVISRSGIGFASLTCDRGFQPLRWRVVRLRNGGHAARLIDRSDGSRTLVELFAVDTPLVPVGCDAAADIAIPANGGLLRAIAGDAKAVILLPTEPNRVFRLGSARPAVTTGSRTSQEVSRLASAHRMWATAEQPADPFARRQRDTVLDAITAALIAMVAGPRWANLEHRMKGAKDPAGYLSEMQRCVGDVGSQKALAEKIARSFWKWTTQEELISGFAEVAAPMIGRGTIARHRSWAKFLLTLADQPGQIVSWSHAESDELIAVALNSPVLLRAARFAILGMRALSEPQDAIGRHS